MRIAGPTRAAGDQLAVLDQALQRAADRALKRRTILIRPSWIGGSAVTLDGYPDRPSLLAVGNVVTVGAMAYNSDIDFEIIIGGLMFMVVGLAASFYFFGTPNWVNAFWYSNKYMVSLSDVDIAAKPHDCDFWQAPVGNKNCHYKAVVNAYNAAGRMIDGDYAPKYRIDGATAKPMVSFDDGKTWVWSPEPDLSVKRVQVYWEKVRD